MMIPSHQFCEVDKNINNSPRIFRNVIILRCLLIILKVVMHVFQHHIQRNSKWMCFLRTILKKNTVLKICTTIYSRIYYIIRIYVYTYFSECKISYCSRILSHVPLRCFISKRNFMSAMLRSTFDNNICVRNKTSLPCERVYLNCIFISKKLVCNRIVALLCD